MVIVMLNMLSLILLRSHTSDIEWIFGRSQVYLPYMSDVATPPPFNIFAICLNVYRDFMKRRNCPEYWQEEEKLELEWTVFAICLNVYRDFMKSLHFPNLRRSVFVRFLSSSIINIYRASCNPVYIFQTSDDPFLSAFCLSQDLEICSKFYHVFRSSYEELLHRTKQFTVDLIDCCRDASEVEIVLKRRKGTTLMKSRFKYPLLMVAMDYRQRFGPNLFR
ncbi:uncharacterized protein LOC103522044 [Diaphorina citri]|uniref:Uncharacterized protein LOC103522044 n=1 Tax=Diaphorina citri TaxID=121845 RepID=A0A3Q0JIL6_DIACI|nr:uncharacterized protein LOC103522044 [Diaphorina citri]